MAVTDISLAMPPLVPLREFIVSPGFAGAAALVGALIVVCAVLYAVRRAGQRFNEGQEQRENHHLHAREDEQRAAALRECRERFQWLVDTAGMEPASRSGTTLGLTPEVALELLRGLLRDAEKLGDQTLADTVTVFQNQFALVLAQQGGPLSGLAAAASGSVDGMPDKQPPSSSGESSIAAGPAGTSDVTPDRSAPPADETAAATPEVAASGRRRRR